MVRLRQDMDSLIGTSCGSYQLLEPFRKRGGKRSYWWWKCRCVCGTIVERRHSQLLYHEINRSPECHCSPNWKPKRGQNRQWKGCGEISGSYLASIRQHAKHINREYSVTAEQLWNIFLQQDRRCAISGLPIVFRELSRQSKSKTEQTASLDRIDSSRGYTIDNVWWVHKHVNYMKNHFSVKRFVEVCQKIAKRFPRN